MDDATLVRQAREGQATAYETLVRRWSARVTGYVRAKVGSAQVAEDLTQDSLFKAFRALGDLSNPDKFGSWLLSIAHRSTVDWLRAKARTEVKFADLVHPGSNGRDSTSDSTQQTVDSRWSAADDRPEEIASRNEQRDRLLCLIADLPEKQREVLMIYYYDDVTYQQIADMLGCLLYTSPSPRDATLSRMPSSA